MTSLGRPYKALRVTLVTAALWTASPLAARADNCPRGTNPCPGSQHSQPAPPARAPAPAPPPAPRPQPQQTSPAPQAQGQRSYPQQVAPRAPQYPPAQPPGPLQYQQQPRPPGSQQYPQPARAAPGTQQYQQVQHAAPVSPAQVVPQNHPQSQAPQKSPPDSARAPQQLSPREQPHPLEHGQPQQVHAHADAERGLVHEPSARHEGTPTVAQRRVPLSPSASLITKPGHAGFTAVDRESAHTSIVVEQHADRHGRAEVNAYRQVTSADGHTTTRLYADGRRTVETPTFRSTGSIGGTQFVRYRTGLRDAYLSNGHPLYAERFTKVSVPGVGNGRPTRIVERTIYASSVGGRYIPLSQPIQLFYSVTTIGGSDTFVYRPRAFDPNFFPLFYAPLAAAILIGPQCAVCPPPVVAFAAQPAQYSDPIELLGDMQVADAVADQGVAPVDMPGGGGAPPGDALSGGAPPGDASPGGEVQTGDVPASDPAPDAAPNVGPEPPPAAPAQLMDSESAPSADVDALNSMRAKAETLRKQAADKAAAAADTASPPATEANPTAVTLQQVSLKTEIDDPKIALLPVPDDVREQIHKQVRLGVAQHANDHPLALTEVMQAGYSRIFLFQVAGPLDTASVVTGDACALGSGDLIAFATTADAQTHPTAQMKVVATRPGHCLMEDTIDVSVSDLQDMLNTFNERLEGNMRRLQTCLNAKDGCVRT